VALQDPEADELLPDVDEETKMASWHLVLPDGRRYRTGAALPPLLRALPAGRLLASVAAAAPGVTERGYRWVADHRNLLGRAVGARARRRAGAVIARRR
jgi:predicted DCC family thiol-disulfide oxidoreductase YuxK